MRAVLYLGLVLLALVVRLVYLGEWHDTALFSVLLGDGRQYDLWASGIAGGDWFGKQVFYQAPMYPYFLALVYRVFGHDLWLLRIVQVALGSVSCLFLALAGRRFFDERVGLVAGFLLALYAPAIYFDGLVQKGVLGVFFMTLLLFTLGEFAHRKTWPWLLGAGLTLGVFALTRENALILPPIVVLWLLVQDDRKVTGRRMAWSAVLLVGVALVLVPVGLRNQALGGRFLVTTSQAGPNFYIGNHTGASGRYAPLREGRGNVLYERLDATELAQAALGRDLDPAQISEYWLARSLSEIRSSPASWIGLMARKWMLVWNAGEIMDTDSLEAYGEHSVLLRLLGLVLHFGVVAPLAAIGLWVTRHDWRRLWLLHAILLAMALAVTLFFVMARYRYPLVPILALFAGVGLIESVRLARERDWNSLARLGALAAFVALACNWPMHGAVDPRTITYYSLGSAMMEEGRFEEARTELERALALDSDFVEARFKLGDTLTNLGRGDLALDHLRHAIRLDPQHAGAHTVLGSALMEQGLREEAATHYLQAIEIDPQQAAAYNNLAVLLARGGRMADAIPYWEKALELSPTDVEARTNLALVLLALGRVDEARAHYQRARELAPGSQAALNRLEAMIRQQEPTK